LSCAVSFGARGRGVHRVCRIDSTLTGTAQLREALGYPAFAAAGRAHRHYRRKLYPRPPEPQLHLELTLDDENELFEPNCLGAQLRNKVQVTQGQRRIAGPPASGRSVFSDS